MLLLSQFFFYIIPPSRCKIRRIFSQKKTFYRSKFHCIFYYSHGVHNYVV